jgi:hypothetical protein
MLDRPKTGTLKGGEPFVSFKSLPEYFEKEADGRKPNTVRRLENDDPRLEWLRERVPKWIVIDCTDGRRSFIREITDITFWDGLAIISWKLAEGV